LVLGAQLINNVDCFPALSVTLSFLMKMSSSITFRPSFALGTITITLLVVLALVVGFTHALSLPPISSKEKRSDIVCGAASWEDVVVFFLLNYVAHAATIRHFPGDTIKTQIWYTACALFFPFTGVWRACQSIANARPFEKDQLERAKYAGALCVVMYYAFEHLTELRGCRLKGKKPPITDDNGFVSIAVGERFHLNARQVNQKSEKIHGAYSGSETIQVLPPNVKVANRLCTAEKVQLSTSNSLLKSAIAIVQLMFACFTLYRTRGAQVENYGYAAFGFTVIPYAIMSVINLTANLLTPEYPTLFMVHSDGMDLATEEHNEFDGVVGTIIPKDTTSEDDFNYIVPSDGRVPGYFSEYKIQIPREYTGTSDGELTVEYSSLGRHKTIPNFKKSQRIRNHVAIAVGIIALIIPYVLIAVLNNGFQKGSISTPLERGFVMSWLVIGQVFGAFFGLVGHNNSTHGNIFRGFTMALRGRVADNIVIVLMLAALTPAIGGFVVVGMMIKQFGSCVLV